MKFENLVSLEGYKAFREVIVTSAVFENLVNSEGYKANCADSICARLFENLVSSEGYKASGDIAIIKISLRTL